MAQVSDVAAPRNSHRNFPPRHPPIDHTTDVLVGDEEAFLDEDDDLDDMSDDEDDEVAG